MSRSSSQNRKSEEEIIIERMKQISSSGTSTIALSQTLENSEDKKWLLDFTNTVLDNILSLQTTVSTTSKSSKKGLNLMICLLLRYNLN